MNGGYNNRTRLLKRAVVRLENEKIIKKNIAELREEGHTEGDIKRYMKQFVRKETMMMSDIDKRWETNFREVEVLENGALQQISQCSLTDGCRLLQCIPEHDGFSLSKQNNAALEIQRVSRGGNGRRKAANRKADIELMRKNAVITAFQVSVLDRVETNAADHRQSELRRHARDMLSVADHDSAQFRWYGKLQVVLQHIEEQKKAIAVMIAGAGIKDPHPSLENLLFEPCCRSLQELRQKQRRHRRTERLNNAVLLKLAESHKLPMYAKNLNDNMGEHSSSNMSAFARLGNIQEETKNYFDACESINKQLGACASDAAHWDDPSVHARFTAQEISRNKKRIKESRDSLNEELRLRREDRNRSRSRRASLSGLEELGKYVVQTRGRQRLRIIGKRRRSLNLREMRIRKDVEEADRISAKMTTESIEGARSSLSVCAMLGFSSDEKDPHNLNNLLDDEILHTSDGIAQYQRFLKVKCLGIMDVDTYYVRKSELRRRSKSICAPERYKQARNMYVARMEGFVSVWDLARDENLPPILSTSWGDEPTNKRSTRPRLPYSETYGWSRDRWEEESRNLDVMAENNNVKFVSPELMAEMEEIRLRMYPPEDEEHDEDGELDDDLGSGEGEDGDEYDEEEDGDWDDEEDWDDEDWGEDDEYDYKEEDDVNQGINDAIPLPEGWKVVNDESQGKYYWNEITGESSWEIPRGSTDFAATAAVNDQQAMGETDEEWQFLRDENGNAYYFNPKTGESEWA